MSTPVIGIDERRPITGAVAPMFMQRHVVVMKSGAIVGLLSVRDRLQPPSVDDF